MARRRLLAAIVGVLALGVPSALADKGGDPHDGSNGNGRPAEQTQAPADQAAQPQGLPEQAAPQAQENAQAGTKAKPAHPAKPEHPTTPNGPKGPPQGTDSPAHHGNPHANAGKITICHATGSATNPYVEITIDENGLNGHDGHDGDIIPAPAEGCPGGETPPPPLVPPMDTHVLSALTEAPTTTLPAIGVLGAETMSPVEIAPAHAASPVEVAAAQVTAPKTANAGQLPFTGRDALLVALLGILLLGVGLTVRRLAAER